MFWNVKFQETMIFQKYFYVVHLLFYFVELEYFVFITIDPDILHYL